MSIVQALRFVIPGILAALAVSAAAQYPDKPIRVIVPFLAGGTADTLARIVTPKLSAAWGQPIVVDNRSGAGGNVGADAVVKSAPDGYTLLFTPPGPLSINMHLYSKMPFDARTAFAPLSVLGVMPNILMVGPHVAAKDVGELVAVAKANPGKLSYGSQGIGSTPHLTGAMLAGAAGIDIVHVPYKGFPPILADLLGGRIDFAFSDTGNVLPQLRNERVRAIAVASLKRFNALPDVPTMIEAGYPDFVSGAWMSFAGPAGLPQDIARKWHEELGRVIKMPDILARFTTLGVEAWASSPEEMQKFMESESKRWGDVVKRTGARAN